MMDKDRTRLMRVRLFFKDGLKDGYGTLTCVAPLDDIRWCGEPRAESELDPEEVYQIELNTIGGEYTMIPRDPLTIDLD